MLPARVGASREPATGRVVLPWRWELIGSKARHLAGTAGGRQRSTNVAPGSISVSARFCQQRVLPRDRTFRARAVRARTLARGHSPSKLSSRMRCARIWSPSGGRILELRIGHCSRLPGRRLDMGHCRCDTEEGKSRDHARLERCDRSGREKTPCAPALFERPALGRPPPAWNRRKHRASA